MKILQYGWLLGLALLSISCKEELADITPGLTSLRVEFVAQDGGTLEEMTGTAEKRLAEGENYPVRLRVTLLDEKGQEIPDRTEKIKIKAMTGKIGKNFKEETAKVESGGVVDVVLKQGYGDVVFWVETVDDLPKQGPFAMLFWGWHEKFFATGISDPMYLPLPTVKTIQTPTSGDGSPWELKNIRLETGDLIVEHVGGEGFWFVDTSLEDYNALFVYTRNSPYLDVGDKLKYISGNVMEFYGTTQLSYSFYEVESSGHAVPDPVELTAAMVKDKDEMERWESRLVRVSDVLIKRFDQDTEALSSYLTYKQYPVTFQGGGAVTLYTKAAAPDFDPREHVEATISYVTGILKQHYSANPQWIILARDADDMGEITEADTAEK